MTAPSESLTLGLAPSFLFRPALFLRYYPSCVARQCTEYCRMGTATTHPWHPVSCAWPLPCTSPHLLRGDTALPLPASCTHLMFLCRLSCGLVLSQALILFDSPGSHRNCGFVSKRAILWETGSDRTDRKANSRTPNLGGSTLITHPLLVHSALFKSASSRYPTGRPTQYTVPTLRRRPSSTGGHAPAQPRLPGTVEKLWAMSSLAPLPSLPLRQRGYSCMDTSVAFCVFLLGPLSVCPCFSLLGRRRRNPFATVTLRQLDMVLCCPWRSALLRPVLQAVPSVLISARSIARGRW